MVTSIHETSRNLLQKICAWLHGFHFHQNHIYTDHPPSSLEQFLRDIWGAIFWAIVLILLQVKLNSQLSFYAFFLKKSAHYSHRNLLAIFQSFVLLASLLCNIHFLKYLHGPLPSARHTGVLYRPSGTLYMFHWDAVSLCACRLLSFVMRWALWSPGTEVMSASGIPHTRPGSWPWGDAPKCCAHWSQGEKWGGWEKGI